MSRLYRSREGAFTAVDTKTQLTTLGSETAPGPLLVPAGARRILKIIASGVGDNAAAADGAILVRLEGPGLPEGPESITVGSGGVPVATGAQQNVPSNDFPLEIPVTIANEILVFVENVGADLGAGNAGVTLVFEVDPTVAAPTPIPQPRRSNNMLGGLLR